MSSIQENIRTTIRENYANVAREASSGTCSCGCSCGGAPINLSEAAKRIGYSEDDLANVPPGANMGLGCGNPLAISELKNGETVLDLGCGGGFDCFLACKQVGGNGYVIGVDMTPDMIQLARSNVEKSGYQNVEFRLGEIENLPVADTSIDVIISNCVINLALDKQRVFRECFRVLKPNGRLSISDVVAHMQLPDGIRKDLALISSCIGGAEYVETLREMLGAAGFRDIKLTPKENSKEIVKSWALGDGVEDYVSSYIIQAQK